MHEICNAISACGGSEKTRAKIGCSVIRANIALIREGMRRRQEIQDKCFTSLDERHKRPMAEFQNALGKCLALDPINCAPDIPW